MVYMKTDEANYSLDTTVSSLSSLFIYVPEHMHLSRLQKPFHMPAVMCVMFYINVTG